MEPLSALGVVTAVVQFLDFVGKVVASTGRIYILKRDERNQRTALNDVESIARNMIDLPQQLNRSVYTSNNSYFSSQGHELAMLSQKYEALGLRLVTDLGRLKTPRMWISRVAFNWLYVRYGARMILTHLKRV
jgi:hypothetical protein